MDLLPHQQPAFDWAVERSRIALFLEMRLGKTVVTTKWVEHHRLKRVLLIAPWNTLVGNRNWEGHLRNEGHRTTMLCDMDRDDREGAARWTWQRGIVDCIKDDGFARPGDTTSGLVRRPATGWFLIHYEGLRVTPELLDLPWDGVVVDESTRIRNPKAIVTKLLLARTDIEHRAILSGLPNPEDPLDFFAQFQFLLGHFDGWTNFWAYRATKFMQGSQGWDWYPKTGTRESIKQFVHSNSYILSRAKANVGSTKVYETRTVAMGAAQKKALREVAKKWAYGDKEAKHAPVRDMWMQRIAGGFAPTNGEDDTPQLIDDGKIRLLHEVLTEELPQASVVVWFRFNAEIDAVYDFVQSRKRKSERVSCERVHGGLDIPKSDRAVIQDRFQEGKTRVLLLQVLLGRFGWDLSRADDEIYYSNTYEFETRSQSEDRIIHPKKTNTVRVIDLVTIGSPDEDVVESLGEKKTDSHRYRKELAGAVIERLKKYSRVNPGDRL